MCEEICVPGSATVALTLPVSADSPPPDATFGAKIRATVAGLPRADPAWKATASRSAKNITLHVTPAAPASAPAAGPAPKLHFFSDDGVIAYDEPQSAQPDGQGGFTVTLPLATDGPKDAKKLLGVLTTSTSWTATTAPALRGLRIETPFTAAAPPSTPIAQLLGTLALALVGGLVLNLMPCVFPVLGIKILGFVNQSGSDKAKIVRHGLVFTAGVLLSFWALAGACSRCAPAAQLGWGFQLQSPAFVFGMAVFLLVFALNLSGLFEVGLAATGVGGSLQMQQGYAGSFFTGALAVLVATPCSAPFLAPALGAALSLSAFESLLVFTAIAVGLAAALPAALDLPLGREIPPAPRRVDGDLQAVHGLPALRHRRLARLGAGRPAQRGRHAHGALRPRAHRHGRLVLRPLERPRRLRRPRVRFGVHRPARWSPRRRLARLAAAARPHRDQLGKVERGGRRESSRRESHRLRRLHRPLVRDLSDQQETRLRLRRSPAVPSPTKKSPRSAPTGRTRTRASPPSSPSYQRSAVPFNVIWLPGKDDPVILPEILTPGIVLDAVTSLQWHLERKIFG
jgi:cytochrome c biogenesis protein CcdA